MKYDEKPEGDSFPNLNEMGVPYVFPSFSALKGDIFA